MRDSQKEHVFQLRHAGMSYVQIAESLNISANTIKSICRRNTPAVSGDIRPEKPPVASEENTRCKHCGKTLVQVAKQKPRKFCSNECRLSWWRDHDNQLNKKAMYTIRCAGCGQTFESYGNKARKYCGHACYIKNRFGEVDT